MYIKIKLILNLILVIGITSSCNKFLEVYPKDSISPEQYYESEEQLNLGLNAVYQSLASNSIYGNNGLYLLGWCGDEGYMSRYTSTITNGAFAFNGSKGDPYVTAFWRELYNGINRANLVIANTDNNKEIEITKRNVIKGEALFLRGYFYFLLVQYFGGVPLRLDPSTSVIDVHLPRATTREVYDQILSDMTAAEELVSDISAIGFGGRISKSAVRGILARVNLYMATYPLKDISKFEDVIKWAKKVIDDPIHKLNANYSDIFIKLARDEYDIGESIFEIEYWGNGTDIYNRTGRNGWMNGIYCQNTATGRADAYMFFTVKLVEVYDDSGDTRKWWSLPFINYVATGAAGNKTLVNEPYTEAQKFSRTPGKFRREYETLTPKMATHTPINVPVLRLADVYLMYAEASNELYGPTTKGNGLDLSAADALNIVRQRAWSTGVKSISIQSAGSGYTSAPTVTISGGGGTGATATARISGGGVTQIILDRDPNGILYFNEGTGYSSAPTVTISGGGGSGAQAVATIHKKDDALIPSTYLTSRETFRSYLQDERVRELNFENLRLADLIRWELLYENMHEMGARIRTSIPGTPYASYFENVQIPKHYLYPIPDAEMINNKEITQNPEW